MSDDGSQRDGSIGELSQPSSSSSGDNVYHPPFFQIPQLPIIAQNQINGYNNHIGPDGNLQDDSDRVSGYGSGYSNATTAVMGDLEDDSQITPTSQDEISPKIFGSSGDSNDTKLSSLSSQLSASFGSPGSQSQRSKDEFVLSQPNALPSPHNVPTASSPIRSPQPIDFSEPLVVLDTNTSGDEETLIERKYEDYYNIASYKGAFDQPPDGEEENLKLGSLTFTLTPETAGTAGSVGDAGLVVSESSAEGSLDLKTSRPEEGIVVPESDNDDELMNVSSEGCDELMKENGSLNRIVIGDVGALSEARVEMFSPNNDLFAPLRHPILDFQRAMQDLPGPSGVSRPRSNSVNDDVLIIGIEEPKWRIKKPSKKSTYTSLKGKGRGKRSKPVDPEEETGAKIGRFSCEEPAEGSIHPEEQEGAKSGRLSCEERAEESEGETSQQVLESLCVQVEKCVDSKESRSSNQLSRSKSDIPISCESLVSKNDLRATSFDDKCVKKERHFAKRRSNYFSNVDPAPSQDLFSDLSEPAQLTERAGELVRRTTTTTYKMVCVQEDILDGDLVLDSVITEKHLDPHVVVHEETMDFEDYANTWNKFDDDDDDEEDDDDDYDRPDEKNMEWNDVVMQPCDNNAKNLVMGHCLTLSDIPASFNDVSIGKRVMARWKDGFFYPGIVMGKDEADRWVVKYDDGSVRPAMTTIFAIDILPVKLDIFAQLNTDLDFKLGTILSQEIGGDEVKYLVELRSGDRRVVPHSAIALSLEQSEIFKLEDKFVEPGITLDNIVAGKRRHKSTNYSLQSPDKEESVRSKGGSACGSARKIVQSSKHWSCRKSNTTADLTLRFSEKLKGRRNILFRPDKTMDGAKSEQAFSILIIPEHGPIPPEGSELFKGKKFLITQGPPLSNEIPPLSKVHLRSQITAGGGVVLADLIEDEIKTNTSECFLISDSHCRTSKYIIALSVSIPCVSHLWIINCCKQAKLLDCGDFMLPAGFSVVTNEIIEWHGRKQIFGGLCCAFAFDTNSDCVQLLSQVLNLSGGRVVTDKNSFDCVDVIVADDGLRAPDRENLVLFKKPIVTKEWVFHCLIHGCKLKFAAHDKFTIRF